MKVANNSKSSAQALAVSTFATKMRYTVNTDTKTNKTLPKLQCLVTGRNRTSNIKYLEAKALRLGVDLDVVINSYISRDALKLLRKGESFEQVRATVGTVEGFVPSTPAIELNELLRLNAKGKHS
jgi:phosphotransferase system IIB component